MGFLSSIWKFVAGAAGLVAGFFFVKSEVQENKIKTQQSEIDAKNQEIDAKESQIKVTEKQAANKIKVKDFEAKVAKKETKINSISADQECATEKKVLQTPDNKEYEVKL